MKNIILKLFAIILLAVILSGCDVAAHELEFRMERERQRQEFNSFMEIADEALCYNDNSYFGDALMDSEFFRNTILIDYDSMTVGFLFNGGAGDEFYKYRLKESEPVSNENIQAAAVLHSPGAALTTFYPNEQQPHRTTAIQLETEDGRFFTAQNLTEPDTGFVMALNLNRGMTPGEEERTWAEVCGEPRGYSPYGVLDRLGS